MNATLRHMRTDYGYTLIEFMIAVFLLAVITTGAYQFYAASHQQTVSQMEVSDMQQICRNSLNEIGRTVRMAGYKVGAHDPYRIAGDSLYVFFNGSQPVDTVLFYLTEFTDAEYALMGELPAGRQLFKLMKKVNSDSAAVYADFISGLKYEVVDSTSMAITLEVHASKPDATFNRNNGFRTFINSERVEMRNLSM